MNIKEAKTFVRRETKLKKELLKWETTRMQITTKTSA